MAREKCFCSRCVPTTVPQVCSACGEEVRLGWRNDAKAWWHRETVDHHAILGHTTTQADVDAMEAALDEPRTREDGTTYTTREFDFARMKKAAREAVGAEDDTFEPEPLPEPEVVAEPVEKKSEFVPGGARQIWNLAEKNGWEIVQATRSRGPRTHATTGALLSVSNYFLLKIRLDSADRAAVASWCDNKFSFAYNVRIDRPGKRLLADKTNSDGLKAWIKGEPDDA